MRISSLEIDKFSSLRDLHIREISPKLTVIYGDNESGKTTLMEFIRSSMFESKSRSRYPQADTTDVGRISLLMDDGTPLRIGRKGNRIENLDGGLLPSQILHSMDLQTYENIFAMGLENLMDHKKIIDDDDLKSRFLTIAGTKNLIPFRKQSEKELESLLGKRKTKDSNKKIDSTMAELEKTENDLRDLQTTINRHESLIEDIDRKKEERQTLEAKKKDLEIKRNKYQNAQDQRRNKETLDDLERRLEPLFYSSEFPLKGKQMHSDFSKDLSAKESEYQQMYEELIEIQTELDSFSTPPVLSHSEELSILIEKRTVYQHHRERRYDLEKQLLDLKKQQEFDIQKLGWGSLSPFKAVINLETEDRAKETLQSLNDLKNKLIHLEADINSFRKNTDVYERDVFDRPEIIRSLNRLNELIFKKQLTEQELQIVNAHYLKQKRFISYCSALAFGVGLLSVALGYVVAGASITAVAILTLGFNHYRNDISKSKHLTLEILNLDGEASREAARWKLSLNPREIDEFLENNLTGWGVDFQNARKNTSQTEFIIECQQEMDCINKRIVETELAWSDWISARGFPIQTPPASMDRIVSLINGIMQRANLIKGVQDQLDEGNQFSQTFCDEVSALSLDLGLTPMVAEDQIKDLQKLLEDSKESLKEIEIKRRRSLEISAKIPNVVSQINSIKTLISDLISIAESEDSFLQMAEDHQQYLTLQNQHSSTMDAVMASLKSERNFLEFSELIESSPHEELQMKIENISSEIDNLNQDLKTLDNEMGKLEDERDRMRTQEGLSQLSQRKESLNSEMEQLSKRYAQIVISQYVVDKACDAFMYEKQPAVIKKANEYLNLMTSRRYHMVVDLENMQVKVHDGLDSKSDGQWSSGLGDQIHLSLRLAMAEEMSVNESLPVILDDVLVRFDLTRRQGAVAAIRQLATRRQVLLFTCDRQVERLFREVDLNDTGFLNMVHGSVNARQESIVIGP